MTILHAVHWVISAWRKVMPEMISNCFLKSEVFGPVFGPQKKPRVAKKSRQVVGPVSRAEVRRRAKSAITPEVEETCEAIDAAAACLCELGHVINVEEVIYCAIEVIEEATAENKEEEEAQLIEHLAATFTEAVQEDEPLDDEDAVLLQIPVLEVITGLQRLIEFEQQEEQASIELLEAVRRKLKALEVRELQRKLARQLTLDGWLQQIVIQIIAGAMTAFACFQVLF